MVAEQFFDSGDGGAGALDQRMAVVVRRRSRATSTSASFMVP